MRVRAATADDAKSIRQVHLAAFPTPLEADLVDRLARERDVGISLVAETGDTVVGHILFSRMDVRGDGRTLDALGLAPVAVLPERQRHGIGSALIEQGIAVARDLGTAMIFVLGEPEYYGRFGFTAAAARPFASPYAGRYFQALVLNDAPSPAAGTAEYAAAFRELA
jgi:putative acetyltransferase